MNLPRFAGGIGCLVLGTGCGLAQSERGQPWLLGQVQANTSAFFLYRDHDDGRNAAYPSGVFPTAGRLAFDTACLDDPDSPTGCSTDRRRADCEKGTVLRLRWPAMGPWEYYGLNLEEPENYTSNPRGVGYDLSPGTHLVFRYRSPTGINVQFGINTGRITGATQFYRFPASRSWSELRIPFTDLRPALTDIRNVHMPFFVVTNGEAAPNGGILLLDDIRIEPVPARQAGIPAFPLGNRTCGVIPAADVLPGRVPVPPDQVNRNLTTTYESALTLWALLKDGSGGSRQAARRIADSLLAVLTSDNSGLPLPRSRSGASGLRNAYMNGQATFVNDQMAGAKAGEARLAGFRMESKICGPSQFCLVLDGATGGNNAFAIIALLAAYREFSDARYLGAARSIATWIHELLLDTSAGGFGGYFLGYPDEGKKKELLRGKSVENNADIAAAFYMLADVESELCNRVQAEEWKRRARIAGDFVMRMYNSGEGRFHAGTAEAGASGPGLRLDGERRGSEVVNTFDFLDANTFVPLAMMSLPPYRDAIDWRKPLDWALQQSIRVRAGGQLFEGYSLVPQPVAGPPGIAWEFTGQMAVAMRAVDTRYGEQRYAGRASALVEQIRRAQSLAPFAEGGGIPAATLENGEQLPPYEGCLSTPFQCIAQRPGLAATAWGIFAEKGWNPLGRGAIQFDATPRVVNAASFDGCVAPGGLVSVFRRPLASSEDLAMRFPLPTELGQARLELNGRPVPLLYASETQLNAQIPYEAATGRQRAELVTGGAGRIPAPVEVHPVAPGIFQVDHVRCLALRPDGTPVSETAPGVSGEMVTLFLTGVGPASPAVGTGAPAPGSPLSLVGARAEFTVGGKPARLEFFGLTPGTAGVAQANLELPSGLGDGSQEVVATVDGIPSNACRLAARRTP